MYPLITASALAASLDDPDCIIIDCRFDLADVHWGARAYAAGHIPGARYAHLDDDLSGEKTGHNGRHPLPDWEKLTVRLEQWGVSNTSRVVVYDQHNAMYASRLWWLLRYLGHMAVQVLDGGLAAWEQAGLPVSTAVPTPQPTQFSSQTQPLLTLSADALWANRAHLHLLDARAPERYRGEVEPIDRVAGHIPGAVNYPFLNNVAADGRFLPAETLRLRLHAALGGHAPHQAVAYCGSGVSACHTILAAELAGLFGVRLYPGSWSEWSSDPTRPVATGG